MPEGRSAGTVEREVKERFQDEMADAVEERIASTRVEITREVEEEFEQRIRDAVEERLQQLTLEDRGYRFAAEGTPS